MLRILGNRILVSKIEEPIKEGFSEVEMQDSFVFKGKVELMGDYVDKSKLEKDFIVLFSKYSPDTQEVDIEGKTMKIIKVEDVLAIL